ncbi:calcium-binding protein [Shinella pollutisoli]|uniref:Calcium-binding protein n=1 Tax=Shinella pollutisoli TaxID=2250594 RepID=A0ABV7DA82_9HYPH|nr:calcium-binding protein [Shinella pollutisoli]
MPSIPATWRNDFIANLNVGSQFDPVITQLASGHFLVVWTDSNNSSVPGSPAGNDIIGRVFDVLGNAVTGEIRLNTRNTGDSEFNPTVTALADGGFVLAYDETGSFDDLNIETYSFNPTTLAVTQRFSAELFFDQGTSNPIDPTIASASATSVLAAYHTINADGSDNIVIRTYNPSTNAFGAEIQLLTGNTGTGEDASRPDVAALSNGNYAVAFVNQNPAGTPDELIVHVRNQAGAFVASATVAALDAGLSDPQVAALASGNFVVAYQRADGAGDISFRVYSNAGVALTGGGPFAAANGANAQNEPAVVGLADGSFIIAWDDDTTGQLMGARFGVSGQSVFSIGGPFVMDDTGGASITEIEMAAFADGRFSVTWNDGGDVRVKIMDTRDFVNSPPVYLPDRKQVGTIGNDVFTAAANAREVYGHDGNDTITEAGVTKKYFGGSGNDKLIVASTLDSDAHDGGSGIDTIDWSGSGVAGATFDLANGTASNALGSEKMIGFEHIIATNDADIIFGTPGENTITALGGNDKIEGGLSTDTIDAGAGNDVIVVRDGQFADNVDGRDGIDTYVLNYQNQKIKIDLAAGTLQVLTLAGAAFGPENTVNRVERVTGGAGDDVIAGDDVANVLAGQGGADTLSGRAGNDTLDGGTGVDALTGGSGNDIYVVDNTNDKVIEKAKEGSDLVKASVSFTLSGNVENLTLTGSTAINGIGNGLSNALVGNGARNTLAGGSGNDKIDGKGGADRLLGGKGNDAYVVDNKNDRIVEKAKEGSDLVKASVSFTLSGNVENLTLTGTKSIDGTGNGLSNKIVGNAGKNTLKGGAGHDTLQGGKGGDKLQGGLGADDLHGGSGADRFVFKSIKESTVGRSGRDTLDDFSHKQGDKVDLKAIDANTKAGGNQAFLFIGTEKFHKTAGELRYEKKGGDTFIHGDVNGNGSADFSIKIDASLNLTKGDFLL